MDEKLRQGDLFDYYGELLKENHRRIFEAYVCDDLSLSEIAENEGISRQGVHDLIKRDTRQLEEYDRALGLIEKFRRVHDIAAKLRETTAAFNASDVKNADGDAAVILALSDELSEM